MIKFLKDYTTKALPPEHFEQGQEVNRSDESELYLVRLGVAGFLVDGKLLDQDYQPIVLTTEVIVVGAADRRFAGRAGEMIGLDAPQRASTGPGNAVMFDRNDDTALSQVEFDQLRSDLATSASEFKGFRATSAADVERLTSLLNEARSGVVTLEGDMTTVRADLASARSDLSASQSSVARLTEDRDAARADLKSAEAQVQALTTERDELKAALATGKPAPENLVLAAGKPAHPKSGK